MHRSDVLALTIDGWDGCAPMDEDEVVEQSRLGLGVTEGRLSYPWQCTVIATPSCPPIGRNTPFLVCAVVPAGVGRTGEGWC